MTFCGGRAFGLGDSSQRAPEIVDEHTEIGGENIAPSDDDHIRFDWGEILACLGNGGPQPALDPVALRGVANPLRDREPEAQAEA